MDRPISSAVCPLRDGFVPPVDVNLAAGHAVFAGGELVARVRAPFCCVLIFKIASGHKYVVSPEFDILFLRLCIHRIPFSCRPWHKLYGFVQGRITPATMTSEKHACYSRRQGG